MFKLSNTSLRRLNGVSTDLQKVVKRAIEITEIDFGVLEGLRSQERQEDLVDSGASKTLYSKHLTGDAVDLVAYLGNEVTWDITCYDKIADAMKQACLEYKISVRWGGAWHIADIRESAFDALDMREDYIDYRRSMGREPFVDGVHFELTSE